MEVRTRESEDFRLQRAMSGDDLRYVVEQYELRERGPGGSKAEGSTSVCRRNYLLQERDCRFRIQLADSSTILFLQLYRSV